MTGKMIFNIVATFAEFEADLIKLRAREGMALAKAEGEMMGKNLKLNEKIGESFTQFGICCAKGEG